jgi:hypothetical protein
VSGISCPSSRACWAVGTTSTAVVILTLAPPPAATAGPRARAGGRHRP